MSFQMHFFIKHSKISMRQPTQTGHNKTALALMSAAKNKFIHE